MTDPLRAALAAGRRYVDPALFLAAVTPIVAERGGDEGRAEGQRRTERALVYARTRSTTLHG